LRRCNACGSSELRYDTERGELVCLSCGTVIEERCPDSGPEWRGFSQDDKLKRSRVGGPLTRKVHDLGLATHIDLRDVLKVRGKQRLIGLRMRRTQSRTRIYGSKRLVKVLGELNNVAGRLGYPERVIEDAAAIIRKAVEARLIRSNTLYPYLAVAFYIACKRNGIPKSLNEVMSEFGVSRRELWHAYRKLHSEVIRTPVRSPKPVTYVPRIVCKLGLPAEVQTKASEILFEAERAGLSAGRGPVGLAAAAVYVASILLDHKRTQREVAEKANITEVTVRNRYREIIDRFYIEVSL